MLRDLNIIVKSPSREKEFKKGTGFSLEEIKKSNKSIIELKTIGIKIDYRRKTEYEENIEFLNNLKMEIEQKPKREPFKKKVKAPKKPKKKPIPKEEPVDEIKEEPEKEIKPKKKEIKKVVKKPTKKEPIKLTLLEKLGPSTEKKLIEIGIPDVETLCKEDPKEVATLVKGCSEERVAKWIEEGKKLLEE